MEIGPVPYLRPADEVDPAHLPALKAEVERHMTVSPRTMSIALDEHDYNALKRLTRDRMVAAKERQMLDLCDVRVTVDGPETPAVADVADQLRAMIAEMDPGPFLMFGPSGNRRQRRADAARRRGQA